MALVGVAGRFDWIDHVLARITLVVDDINGLGPLVWQRVYQIDTHRHVL